MTGQQIKKELCELTGLRASQIKIRRGRGTGRGSVPVKIANDVYSQEIVDSVRNHLCDNASRYGIAFSTDDYDNKRYPWISISNFDGVQHVGVAQAIEAEKASQVAERI